PGGPRGGCLLDLAGIGGWRREGRAALGGGRRRAARRLVRSANASGGRHGLDDGSRFDVDPPPILPYFSKVSSRPHAAGHSVPKTTASEVALILECRF
ncbi:hypothetical protein THAOC_22549, partial [Thalassiosira oceanica]